MRNINHLGIAAVILLAGMLLTTVSSCKNSGGYSSTISANDSIQADSIMEAAFMTEDLKRSFHVIDSLLEIGHITPMQADFSRSRAHMFRDEFIVAGDYLKKVVDAYNQDGGDITLYARAVANLVSILGEVSYKYESSLQIAIPAVAKMEASPLVDKHLTGQIYVSIGTCQMALERCDEAEKSFEKGYRLFIDYQHSKNMKLSRFRQSIISTANIFLAYFGRPMPDIQLRFTNRCDSMLMWYGERVNNDSLFIDFFQGQIYLSRAEALAKKKLMKEAEDYYQKFLHTCYMEDIGGRFNACLYLKLAGRYAEAADIYKEYDIAVQEWDLKEDDLENINSYLFPKFQYNYMAGRRDSALAVAVRIDSLIGPAMINQKHNDAAELATIYETQQKEAQIAQQQAQLSEQRLWAAAIVFLLITVFFVIYTLLRRRSARRLAEMKAAQERIESELRIARDIQMSMVPSTFPDYEGLDMFASMTPAKEVGGDLYGYVLVGDKLYFALGDVSGKGVPASLFMAQATRLFRTLAAQQMMPAEICTRMNDALSGDDNESGMFVTFFLGLLNLTTGHLDFCNAGHNPPIIGGGDHHGDFLDMIPNAPIGLFPDLDYEGEQLENIKNRPLFIYTDGLNEAENLKQEQFGDEHLLDILRNTHFDNSQQVIDTLKAEVEAHRNGAEPNDDLTMMCIRYQNASDAPASTGRKTPFT